MRRHPSPVASRRRGTSRRPRATRARARATAGGRAAVGRRPRRHRRPRHSEARSRDLRGRRAQPPADRAAGNGEDHARARPSVHPAAARAGRGLARKRDPQRRGPHRSRATASDGAPVPCPPSHRIAPCSCRRWRPAASGRGLARQWRNALPRRDRGVPGQRPRDLAGAAGRGCHHDLAGRCGGDVSGAVHAHRGAEPLSVQGVAATVDDEWSLEHVIERVHVLPETGRWIRVSRVSREP